MSRCRCSGRAAGHRRAGLGVGAGAGRPAAGAGAGGRGAAPQPPAAGRLGAQGRRDGPPAGGDRRGDGTHRARRPPCHQGTQAVRHARAQRQRRLRRCAPASGLRVANSLVTAPYLVDLLLLACCRGPAARPGGPLAPRPLGRVAARLGPGSPTPRRRLLVLDSVLVRRGHAEPVWRPTARVLRGVPPAAPRDPAHHTAARPRAAQNQAPPGAAPALPAPTSAARATCQAPGTAQPSPRTTCFGSGSPTERQRQEA